MALHLCLPPDLCLRRVLARGDSHPTLPLDKAAHVIDVMQRGWQQPGLGEGFHDVLVASSSEEAAVMAVQLLEQQQQLQLAVSAGAASRSAPATAGAHLLSSAALPFQLGAGSPGRGVQQQQQQQQQYHTFRADKASSWRHADEAAATEQQPQTQAAAPGPRRTAGDGGSSNNAVAFPRGCGSGSGGGRRDLPRRHPWQHHSHDEPSGLLLDALPPPNGDGVAAGGNAAASVTANALKPILMFDANGTLTSHTSMRRSAGVHRPRPGVYHLHRLKVRVEGWGGCC